MSRFVTPAYAVFSGGGAQGIALAGAYQAALDSGFEFKGFGGTSAGAMIALMAATGMSGDEIVSQSVPGRPGHPEKFFSDPPDGGHPGRHLSRILREWSATVGPLPKGRRRNKRGPKEKYEVARGVQVPGAWERVQLFVAAVLLAIGLVSAIFVLITVAYPAVKSGFMTRLPAIGLPAWSEPLQLIATTAVSLVLVFVSLIVFVRLGRLPALDYLLLRPRGRYWRWVLYVLGDKFGFLKGAGMEAAFNLLLAERIAAAANAVGRQDLAEKKFSNLTFEEFESIFRTPIKFVASDLWSGKPIIFERHTFPNHRVFEAVRASTAFPMAFEPVVTKQIDANEIETAHVLVDGGLSSNSPAFLFKRESDFCKLPTIAFQLNYSYPGPRYPEDIVAYFSSLTRTAVGAGDTIIQDLVPRMHVVSVTGLEEYGVLDGDLSGTAVRRLFELGRARQDDMTRIWKLCRIERERGVALNHEYAPLLQAIHRDLASLMPLSTSPGSAVAVAVWSPVDHAGSEWRLEQLEGEHEEFVRGSVLEVPPEAFGDGRKAWATTLGSRIVQLRKSGRHLGALTARTLLDRDMAVLADLSGTAAIAVPISAFSIDPDTWRRGNDVVGILTVVSVNQSLGDARDDSKSWCGWLRQPNTLEPEAGFLIDPSTARVLTNWAQTLGRFMVA